MLSEDQKNQVIEEIQRHYSELTQPYYLAELGQFFRTFGIEVPNGIRLKDFLSENFQGQMVVVQNPTVPAKIAIALLENKDEVLEQLVRRYPSAIGHSSINLNRLPISLVIAFCQKPSYGNRVYFRTDRPWRYAISSVAPDDSYVEIDEQFRESITQGVSVHKLSKEDKQDIYRRISQWAEAKSINLETLYHAERGHSQNYKANQGMSHYNALQRLIEAQEPELRKRIQIPGDIALALMRLE